MRIVIVGGLGFVGSRLVPKLLAEGHNVKILDKRSPPDRQQCEAIQADVRDLGSLQPHFLGQDLVINLAAEHQDNVRPLSLYDEVNVVGARNVCAAAEDAGVGRILFTSSVAVYGDSTYPLTEESPPKYFNDYGRTKHEAEQIYRNWRTGGTNRRLAIVRPTVIFGPGNRGNVYNLLRQIKHGPFVMIGDGRNIKSIAHVDNVASFLLHVIGLDYAGEMVLNYADKPDLSISQLVAICFETLERQPPRLAIPQFVGLAIGGLGDVASTLVGKSFPVSAVRVRKFCSSSIVDSTRALATGFHPSIDTPTALREMIRDHV